MSRVVVITGAAAGIGRALALGYLKAGDRVAALDRNATALDELTKLASSERLSSYVADVTDETGLRFIGEQLKRSLGAPEIWINNAGIANLGKFEDVSSSDFEKVIDVNFLGVVRGTRVALKLMSEPERGTIVNIASVSGTVPAPFLSSYVSAKHAVVGFTRALQLEKELAQSPLRFVLVSPGFVRTDIMAARSGFEFPRWLDWIIETPENTAAEIIRGIDRGQKEIVPTANGKFIARFHGLAPGIAKKSTRLLGAKIWKEALGLSPIKK